MLIPLGILATAGAGGGGGNAFELISTPFLSGTFSTVTFSSIPQDFKHLQIRAAARASLATSPKIQFNGVSTTSYAYHSLWAISTSTTVRSENGTSQNGITFSEPTSTAASAAAPYVIDIFDYASTTKNTTVRSFWGDPDASSDYKVGLHSGFWNSTAAVTSITLTMGAGSWTSATRFSLYGIKG